MPSTVSIIIPTYNTEKFLAETLNSVIDQDYRPIEVVVVDDGSTDQTVALARKILAASALPHHIFTAINGGQNVARNIGLGLATGDLIKFLDHDDILPPWAIQTQVTALEESGADLLIGSIERFDDKDAESFLAERASEDPPPPTTPIDPGHPLSTARKYGPTFNEALVKSKVIRAAGGFSPKLGTCEEFNLLGRISLLTPAAELRYQETPVVLYKRCFEGSLAIRYRNENSTVRNWSLAASEELAREAIKEEIEITGPWKDVVFDGLYWTATASYRDGLQGHALSAIEVWKKAGLPVPKLTPAYHDFLHRLFGFRNAEQILGAVRTLRNFFTRPGKKP